MVSILQILIKMLYAFLISPMHDACPAHFTTLNLITLMIWVKSTSYEAPHYIVCSSHPLLSPSTEFFMIFLSSSKKMSGQY
jgi:hypothetical protein